MDYDFKRQNDLERFGLKVLRLNALDAVQNTQSVLDEIYCWINGNRKPTPNPSQEGVAKRIFKRREREERKVFVEKIKNDGVAFLRRFSSEKICVICG